MTLGSRLTLIIPAYREEKRIDVLLGAFERINSIPELQGIEVLVVVEKSPDQSFQVIREKTRSFRWVRVIDNQVQKGKGYAVRSGARHSRREWVGFCDFDFSTPPEEIHSALRDLDRQPELQLWLGERLKDSRGTQSFLRQLAGWVFSTLTRFCLLGVRDSQCGFKFCRRGPALEELCQLETNGFAFDTEWILRCQQRGLRWAQRPVKWVDCKGSTVRVSTAAIGMFVSLVGQTLKWGFPWSKRRGLELAMKTTVSGETTDSTSDAA
jgi:glycosyltransferase involved in cell wall biosynthesis